MDIEKQLSGLDQIGTALAKAQAEMSNPAYDRSNPHFKSKFASLAAVRNAVIPVLAKHGIACVQDLCADGEAIVCITQLIHASGQMMTFGPLRIPTIRADAQGLGSAGTYARRYALMAIAGVVGDEDDDGEVAINRNGNGKAEKLPNVAPEGYASWKADMTALADSGTTKLAESWDKSRNDLRLHATTNDATWWKETKAKAGKVSE